MPSFMDHMMTEHKPVILPSQLIKQEKMDSESDDDCVIVKTEEKCGG